MRSRECEEIATRAPSATSSVAIARPIPFDAPVTSATLPFKPRSMAGMLSGRPLDGPRREAAVAGQARTPQREERDREHGAEPVHAEDDGEEAGQPGER